MYLITTCVYTQPSADYPSLLLTTWSWHRRQAACMFRHGMGRKKLTSAQLDNLQAALKHTPWRLLLLHLTSRRCPALPSTYCLRCAVLSQRSPTATKMRRGPRNLSEGHWIQHDHYKSWSQMLPACLCVMVRCPLMYRLLRPQTWIISLKILLFLVIERCRLVRFVRVL